MTDDEDLDLDTEEGPRSFAHQVATLCDGDLNAAASQDMHDLLLALRSEAQARCKKVKGTFKLELTIEVNDDDVAGISFSVKTKAPEPRRRTAVMWLSPGANLSPENPRQQNLPGLREVAGGRNETREVGAKPAATREV